MKRKINLQKLVSPTVHFIIKNSSTPPKIKKSGKNLYAPNRCFPGTLSIKTLMYFSLKLSKALNIVFDSIV